MRVSVSSAGVQGNQGSADAGVSETGRFVVFSSFASNLVAGDNNNDLDVFLHDRDADADGVFDEPGARTTIRLTRPGVDPNGQSFLPKITPDGRFVVFTSGATNLAPPGRPAQPGLQVYRYDRLTSDLSPVSLDQAGNFAGGNVASISDDGRWVVFLGVAAEPGGLLVQAINLRDMVGQTTTRLSQSLPQGSLSRAYYLGIPSISGDGLRIAFSEVELRIDQQVGYAGGQITLIDFRTGRSRSRFAPGWEVYLAQDGESFIACGTVPESSSGESAAYWQHIASGERRVGSDRPPSGGFCIDQVSRTARYALMHDEFGAPEIEDFKYRTLLSRSIIDMAFGAGDAVVAVSSGLPLVLDDTNGYTDVYVQSAASYFDRDADTLDDGWEQFFGLSPSSASGVFGATGDPDFDGVTNAAEQAAGTHPIGFRSRYLAEGATGSFFETRLALANPTFQPVSAAVRIDKSNGTSVTQFVSVPARGRASLVAGAAGLGTTDFATVVETGETLVVDRLMTWDARRYGSHAETSSEQPATRWVLAEGTTVLGFQLFYLLQNPQNSVTTATVRFLLPSGAPIVRTYDLAAHSRTSIYVNTIPQLGATDVSAEITATLPIVVERSMYRSQGDQVFALGHAASGIPQPGTNWFLAEGATGAFFDTYVLVANPSASAAAVTMDFLRNDGAVVSRTYNIAANTRYTVFADGLDGLQATTFGARITSTAPVVVERAMYWSGGFYDYYEGHVSAASSVTGSTWVLAEGEVGGDQAAETFVLIANTGNNPVTVQVQALPESRLHFAAPTVTPQTMVLAANSRTTVSLSSLVSGPARAGVEVREMGSAYRSLVVEGAIYWNAEGVVWAAGAALPATRIN